MKNIFFKYFLIILLLSLHIYSKTEMNIRIHPKDSEEIQERIVDPQSFSTRADSDRSNFLIFFDKDPDSCDQ